MNDLVWFGNTLIPRWEAFALMGFGGLMALAALFIFGAGVVWFIRAIVRIVVD